MTNNASYRTVSSGAIGLRRKNTDFMTRYGKGIGISVLLLLASAVSFRPGFFAAFLTISAGALLFINRPETGLLVFAAIIPLHIVMVRLLNIFPGSWKEALILTTIVLWMSRLVVKGRLIVVRTVVDLPFYLFMCWTVSLLLVDIGNFDANVLGLRNLLEYSLLFIIAVNLIRSRAAVKLCVTAVIAVGVVIAAANSHLFLFQPKIFNNINIAIVSSWPTVGIYRMAPLTFMGAEYPAYYWAFISCLLLGFLLFTRTLFLRAVLIVTIAIPVSSIFLTYTRGGIFVLLAAMIFFGIIYNRKFLFASIILYFAVTGFLPPQMYERFITEFFKKSSIFRLGMAGNALNVWSLNPLFGIGLGKVGAVSAIIEDITAPHNYYLYLLLQTGIVGLALYLWIMFIFLKTSMDLYRKLGDGYYKGLAGGMVMFFVAFATSGFFVGSGEAFILAPFYWLFGGLAIALDRIIKREPETA